MKKNYFSKVKTTLFNPLTSSLKNLKKGISPWLVASFVLVGGFEAFGQVTINTANGSINSCTYPTSYVTLGNIFLEENQNSNFGFPLQNTDYTFIITAPANFEFQAGVGSVSFRSGGNITNASINVTVTTITITYRSNQNNRTNQDDRLTISGINFRGITGPSSGNISRTLLNPGSGVINGAGTGTTYGLLTSTNNPLPANGGGATSVCVGSSTPAFTNTVTGGTWSIITGTGNATVSAGGVVTGTSAGTVTVRYTVNGCNSNSSITVNPTPAAITGGSATVCTGSSTPAFTNSTPSGTWSIVNGTGAASITSGGIVTGISAGDATVVYTVGSCNTSRTITIISIPTTVTTPTPTNGATGVCYTGDGAVTSISWGAVSGATSYDVYFGSGSLPATVTATVSSNSYNTGTLLANTTYFWRVVARNTCGNAPSSSTFSFTTNSLPCYCSPSSTNSSVYISSIRSVGTVLDVTNGPTGYSPGGYGDFSNTTIATQVAGSGINLEIRLTGSYGIFFFCSSNPNQFIKTWVDWNNDGDFDDSGEQVYISGTDANPVATSLDNIFGFVVPSGTPPGNYRIRIRTRASCNGNTIAPCAPYTTGETEDYNIAVIPDCPAKILTVLDGSACGPTNTVTLGATATASASGFRWYTSLTGGAPIATTTTGSWTSPSISSTTTYYVTAFNGSCETIHRTPVVATILPTTNITVTPSVPEVCGEGNIVEITASGDFVTETLLLQTFESGMAPFTVSTPINTNGGVDTPWSVKSSVYVPAATTVWRPALNSGAVGTTGNHFAFTTSDYTNSNIQTILTSPVIDASTYNSLSLSFDQIYGAFSGDSAMVQAFDGSSWNTVATYTSDIGTPSVFTKMAPLNLNAYAGNANLQIRFVYTANWDDGWAIDNIKLEGVRPLNTTFTWTGGTIDAFIDAACTTPYTSQAVTTVYVRPTASQLASASWSFTANATLGNGCPVSQLITINNKTKLWKGTADNNWYNPNNWEPVGVPDANTCVFIYPGSPASHTTNINTTTNDGFAKTLTVRPSGVLTIHPGNDLTVTDAVTVDNGGTFNIENSGSLIQVNNVLNSGRITMKRNANFGAMDYVYWSSPVANFSSSSISPGTPTSLIWKWEPTTTTPYTPQYGNWVNGNETMTLGRGYIVRSPNGWPTANTTFTANFTGVPNNGTITRVITRSTYTGGPTAGPTSTPVTANDDNWNLIGNPYPSSIDAVAFLSTNSTHINSFIDLWTHGNAPTAIADPFYQDYQLNYNPNDYLRYNSLGGTQAGFDGKIGAGQGFFILMRDAGGTTENVLFTNAMRSHNHRNDQFFRSSTITNLNSSEIERHRIWLKMISPNMISTDMLVGYATGASNNLDDTFDAMNKGIKANYELYSMAENQGLLIQGRSLPFDQNDRIPLGAAISNNGIHTIAISETDGLFSLNKQSIYLEDLVLGITHDLRAAPYTFTATPGRYENRFVLKFNNETLSNEDFVANSITVYTNESININVPNQQIKTVRVYDLLGKSLGTFTNINSDSFSSKNVSKTQSPLLVEITLENGAVVTKKVIY